MALKKLFLSLSLWSLSSRRAWIEIRYLFLSQITCHSRSPHGERGLKLKIYCQQYQASCRSPHGERGLKSRSDFNLAGVISRSPHGERGLKWH